MILFGKLTQRIGNNWLFYKKLAKKFVMTQITNRAFGLQIGNFQATCIIQKNKFKINFN